MNIGYRYRYNVVPRVVTCDCGGTEVVNRPQGRWLFITYRLTCVECGADRQDRYERDRRFTLIPSKASGPIRVIKWEDK